MSLVQVCLSPHPSLGGPALCYQQFQAVMQGRVVGISRHGETPAEPLVLPCDVHVRCEPGPLSSRYYYCGPEARRRVLAEIEGASLVVLHGFYTHPFTWIGRHCLSRKIPYVLVPHGMFDPWSERKSMVAKFIWRALYGRRLLAGARFLLCATRAEQRKVQLGFPGLRAECLHWACPEIPEAKESRDTLRSRLGLEASDKLCLSLGRLHPMKRPLELARAFAEQAPAGFHLLFVGPEDGVTAAAILAAVPAQARARVHVLPPVYGAARFDWFRSADCYVSASSRENFNFTAAEALGCGLPVLLSPGNDLLGELEGLDFVFPLSGEGCQGLGPALARIGALDTVSAESLGKSARFWARQNLSLEHFREGLGNLLGIQSSTSR